MTIEAPTACARRSREIGPVGAAARVAGGLLLLAWPASFDEIRPWDVAAALIALPILAAAIAAGVHAALGRLAPDSAGSWRSPWSAEGALVLGVVLACAIALTFVTPADEAAVWVFFGVSMLVAALRREGGCEVLALPNLVSGRHDRVSCLLYGPVDAGEARHRLRGAADADRAAR